MRVAGPSSLAIHAALCRRRWDALSAAKRGGVAPPGSRSRFKWSNEEQK